MIQMIVISLVFYMIYLDRALKRFIVGFLGETYADVATDVCVVQAPLRSNVKDLFLRGKGHNEYS